MSLYSRNHKLLNGTYPELVAALAKEQAKSFVADGEIVAFAHRVTSFAALQQRMQVQHPSDELLRRVPAWFYGFDLLFLGTYDLRQVTLRSRKSLLQKALAFEEPLCFTALRETDGERYYREACKRHWEGVVTKNGDSVYASKRSREWLKFKCFNEQEFVIGGYTDPQGQRIGLGALLVGYYEHGKLQYAGKVGTGYDTKTLHRLTKQLAPLETGSKPFAGDGLPHSGVHWVKPKLVAQIGFTEWTGDGKLRHSRFLGLRNDKEPEEVTREK